MQVLSDDHGCAGWRGEMAGRIREFDWSTTALGPIDQWSGSLRAAVQMLLASPVPLVMLWGQPGYMVYNDAYAVFAGGRHPFLLGSPVEQGWPEVADFNRNVVDTCLAGGTLSYRDKELVLFRSGAAEDVWMDLYYSPVVEDDGAPAGVISIVIETTARVSAERRRREAEAAFRAANERIQLALNSGAVLGSFVWDIKANQVTGDERFARTFSFTVDQAQCGLPLESALRKIHPDDLGRVHEQITRTIERGVPYNTEYRIRRADDGEYMWILASGRCDYGDDGQPSRFPGVLVDIHERKVAEHALLQLTRTLEQRVDDAVAARIAVEEQLRQSQKMEAIGALTGGVAHDFNNVLQIISGNLQLLALQERGNQNVQQRVNAAASAVERGAKLSSQLLAFARRQPLSPTVMNPRRIFDGLSDLLQRALGETVVVQLTLPESSWSIKVDRNQLENAVLNLAINSRDAMNGDGRLNVFAENVSLAAHEVAGAGIAAGEYLRITVQDDGPGMPPEVVQRACEPFFTTKEDGRGTGLGLSMVFGFVRQSGGHLAIHSKVGVGTTIQMHFPRSDESEIASDEVRVMSQEGGHETVLVVEDDAQVRSTSVELLQELGYRVLQASNGDAAMVILKSGVKIDLVFTDVVMPGIEKSADLAAWARSRTPAIPVLFTSGHTRDILSRNNILAPGVTLLHKPYRPDTLAKMLRQVLADSSRVE
ncbi:PAS domain-containing hybrid sensor histidine kinase/response regulator [Paraburkholderia metrosideri]|uniref:histidine kinase n=1 Tax=Paraburkholderia metrosideri TaxID=580937 RepID=A0ABN7I993_9BURK|nr:PAS domain-containing hybrid sensor histidine kinase/response regulator [Paraburkholderia metrosideri]CAD6555103.1 Sensor histidine kinase RcsC [Paraburkholderia metrosideri]